MRQWGCSVVDFYHGRPMEYAACTGAEGRLGAACALNSNGDGCKPTAGSDCSFSPGLPNADVHSDCELKTLIIVPSCTAGCMFSLFFKTVPLFTRQAPCACSSNKEVRFRGLYKSPIGDRSNPPQSSLAAQALDAFRPAQLPRLTAAQPTGRL